MHENGSESRYEFLGKMLLEISGAPDDSSVYNLIASQVRAHSAALFVVTAEYDTGTRSFVPVGLSADQSGDGEVSQLLDDLVGKRRPSISESEYQELLANPISTSCTLADATFGSVPEELSDKAEKELGLRLYQNLTLTASDEIIGVVLLGYTSEVAPLDGQIASVLAHICGLLIREHRAQMEKRSLEGRYQELAEMLPEAVFETDLNGRLVFANNSAFSSFGYQKEDLEMGIDIQSLVAPGDLDRAAQNMARAAERGHDSGPTEYTLIRKNGEKFPALISINLVYNQGVKTGFRGIAVDLSSTRKEENRKAQLVAAFEQSAESILVTDSIARVQYANPAFLRITGRKRDEIVGKLPFELAGDGEERGTDYHNMWQALQKGESWRGPMSGKHKNGTPYILDATISPVRGTSGVITNFVAAMRDVTYEKGLEERYRHAQKMEAVGRLAGGIAHDFNNLMTAVAGYTDLIRGTLDDEDERQQDFAEILAAVDKASRLTGQLLAFSRKQVAQPKAINLNDSLRRMRNMLERLLGEDVELSYSLESDLPDVLMDPGQLEQVILNLAVNARDAMPDGGKLDFITTYRQDGESGKICMEVRDCGEGMDSETLSRIFEPFFTTKESGKGTGLGLSTVYGIVEQNDADIDAESSPGQGSSFTVIWPVRGEIQKEDSFLKPPKEEQKHRETILLVEDEELVRKLTTKVLKQEGFRVIDSGEPDNALQKVSESEQDIAVLVSDVVMPGMTGKELAERVLRQYPCAKVLFISGYTNEMISSKGIMNGTVPFLQKPFSPSDLIRKIHELLEES